jgi:uncharacterized protein YfiM (DUF2279 family)
MTVKLWCGFLFVLLGATPLLGQTPDTTATPVISHPGLSGAARDSLERLDPWLGFDKVQHFTFSFLWLLSTQYIVVNKMGMEETSAYPYALASGALVGLLKEMYDARRPGGFFSKRDLVADGCGLLLATVVVWAWP